MTQGSVTAERSFMDQQQLHLDDQLIVAPPESWKMRLTNIAIAVFLLAQIGIPASYYLVDEPTTERFSWRMFSSSHYSKWNCMFIELVEHDGQHVERVVPIDTLLQAATCKKMRDMELAIVSKFMRQWCQRPGVQSVTFSAHGKAPSGRPIGPVRLTISRADGIIRRIEP